jgi:hypothetical protein
VPKHKQGVEQDTADPQLMRLLPLFLWEKVPKGDEGQRVKVLTSIARTASQASPANIFTISDAHHNNANRLVFNGTNSAVVPNAVLPKLPQLGTTQRLTNGARVFKWRYPIIEERQDAPCILRIKLFKIFPGEVREFNSPSHRTSSRL